MSSLNKYMSWCIKNGITIIPNPVGTDRIELTIKTPTKEINSPNTYTNKELSQKINQLYKSLYDKNNTNNVQ